MSRIGRLPITVPADVDVTLDGSAITMTGPKGTLSRTLNDRISVVREDDRLVVSRPSEDKTSKSLHGLTRTLVNNMVVGVTTGYRKPLEITGVGYRAVLNGTKLTLNLGYSHPIEIDPPAGISFEVETPTKLAVVGIDKELVGQVAAEIPPSGSRSPTRARASDTPARSSAARPARPARWAGRSDGH